MTDTPDEIARGLTDAQRACLELTMTTSLIDIALFAPNGALLIGQLRESGLIGGLGDATHVTPLGLAVRQII